MSTEEFSKDDGWRPDTHACASRPGWRAGAAGRRQRQRAVVVVVVEVHASIGSSLRRIYHYLDQHIGAILAISISICASSIAKERWRWSEFVQRSYLSLDIRGVT